LQGGEKVLAGLQLFDTEFPNIRTGQEWATANILVNKMASELCNAYPDLAKNCLELRLNVHNRISWLNQAIRAARMLKDEQSESWHLGNRGVDYNDLGKPRQAIRDLEIALTIARKIHDHRVTAQA
jgi:hypothetical protein